MKGTSKVIMGATLIMMLSLAIVVGLILVLLAELYCSLLVRRRQLHRATTTIEDPAAAEAPTNSQNQPSTVPPFLFPSLAFKEKGNAVSGMEHSQQLRQFLESSQAQHSGATTSALQVRILSSTPASPNQATESQLQTVEDTDGSGKEHLMYISNPMFDDCGRAATPYATPDTSLSRLGNSSGSSDEDDETSTLQSDAQFS